MASPRITQTMREKIATSAVKHALQKRYDKASAEYASAFLAAYDSLLTSKEIDGLKAISRLCDRKPNGIAIRCNGEHHYLNHTGRSWKKTMFPQPEGNLDWRVEIPDKERNVTNQKLADAVCAIARALEEIDQEANKTMASLLAVLESVQTFKKLRSIWPEGEIFYNMYDVDHTNSPKVPAPVIADLNKALGL